MRRKALMGVVAAAVVPLLATPCFSQTPAPAPAQKPPAPTGTVDPKWRVRPTPPAPAAVPPLTTPPVTRGYSQFDELLEPRTWPRDDPINRMPETPGDRQDNDFGLESVPAYDATRPEDPLGPFPR